MLEMSSDCHQQQERPPCDGMEANTATSDASTHSDGVSHAVDCRGTKRSVTECQKGYYSSSGVDCEIDGDKVTFMRTPEAKKRMHAVPVIDTDADASETAFNFIRGEMKDDDDVTDTRDTPACQSLPPVLSPLCLAPPATLTRPRSCSSTLDALPLAMMSPLLVASSPLARSTPSLLPLQPAVVPVSAAGSGRGSDASAGHNLAKVFSRWNKATTEDAASDGNAASKNGRLARFSHPLAVPLNPFRRSSLQSTKPDSTAVARDTNIVSDNERLASVGNCEDDINPALPDDATSELGDKALQDLARAEDSWRRRDSSLGDPFQTRARCSSASPALSVAVVPPMQDVSQSDTVENDKNKTLTRTVPDGALAPSHPPTSAILSRPSSASTSHPPHDTTSRAGTQHSPSKAKLSSKHSSKHSSPVKSLVQTATGVAVENSDSPDSDDLSSRVSAGGGVSLEVAVCPHQHTHHTGREVFNKVYPIPIDNLFTLLFTTSKMMLDVHTSRKTHDFAATPWQSKDATQQRLRQVTYTVTLPTNSFGPKVSHVTETQVMSEFTVPGEYYSVDSEASNAGIPYADSFLVSTHWCLTRETRRDTRLVVWTSVKYKKTMWGFMKGVIDKNACAGVETMLADIDASLTQEVAQQSDMRQRTRRRRRRCGSKNDSEVPSGSIPGVTTTATGPTTLIHNKESKPAKEHKQAVIVSRILGSVSTALTSQRHLSLPANTSTPSQVHHRAPLTTSGVSTTSISGRMVVAVAVLVLVLTNAMLYWRLGQLEMAVQRRGETSTLLDSLDAAMLRQGGPSSETWLQVLQQQEDAHAGQVAEWRQQVADAAALLHQAEAVLRGLHSAIPLQHAANVHALLSRRLQSMDHTTGDTDQHPHPSIVRGEEEKPPFQQRVPAA